MSGEHKGVALMAKGLMTEPDFLVTVLNAIPSAVLVVDSEFRVCAMNARAAAELGIKESESALEKLGETLRCTNALGSLRGCGESQACETCVLRLTVDRAAMRQDVYQHAVTMLRVQPGGTRQELFMFTAAPFTYHGGAYILLSMENLSELDVHPELIPICAQCKKIRTENQGWESPEAYMRKRAGLDFSHTICPECLASLYPSFYKG